VTDAAAPMASAPATTRALTCPNCGGTVALRAAGLTVTLVCEHCTTTLDVTGGTPKLVERAAVAMRRPDIALGTRGTLRGTLWEVVGYQERTDGYVGWSEYLLFNPYAGYSYLVDDRRRYSLGRVLDRLPEVHLHGLWHRAASHTRFGDPYEVKTDFVLGEFPWRARVGETVTETDYVRPGTMLSTEANGAERTWTELTMLAPGEAERAFGVAPRRVPVSGRPSPHEPSPYADAMKEAVIVGIAATLAVIGVAIFTPGQVRAFRTDLLVPLDGATHTAVVGPVELPAGASRVTVSADAAGLNNQWVDLDYSLTHRKTQASYDVYATAERYSGTDTDGRWTEGNGRASTAMSSIPGGSYDLVVEASAHKWEKPGTSYADPFASTAAGPAAPTEMPVTLTVTRGGGFFGNAVLALILIWAWPLIQLALHMGFEQRRRAPLSED